MPLAKDILDMHLLASARQPRRLLPLSLMFMLLSTSAALASGSMGSVSSPAQTGSSITVAWTAPTGDYTHCASPPSHQVCIKVEGTTQIACNQPLSTFTSASSHIFTPLTPNTLYKIRVFTKAKKNGHNCKYREVASIKQMTKEAIISPIPGYAHLSLATTPGTLAVTTEFAPGAGVAATEVRICYKQAWWPAIMLTTACLGPLWSTNNDIRGSAQLFSPSVTNTVTFPGLPECRQYKVIAYGYPYGQLIGQGSINIAGDCHKSLSPLTPGGILTQLVANHDAAALAYQTATDQHLRGAGKRNGLLDVLVGCDPAVASELQALRRDSEKVTTDVDLLEYVAQRPGTLLTCWQSSPAIPSHLTIEPYLAANYPDVLTQIRDDQDPPR